MASFIARIRELEDEKRTPEERLLYLSRAPAACPISSCKMMMFSSNVLAHYYGTHAIVPQQQIIEAFESQRSLLYAKMQATSLEENHCFGMLLYAGYDGKPETLPARRFLSFKSDVRFGHMIHFNEHLPVMIMMCRTTWSALMHKKISKDHIDISNEKNHIFIVWCVSANTLLNLYVTITVFDDLLSKSRSGTRRVRKINDSQDVNEFCPNDSNYLLLTQADVNSLLEPKFKTLNLEVILHEEPTISAPPAMPTSSRARAPSSKARAPSSKAIDPSSSEKKSH